MLPSIDSLLCFEHAAKLLSFSKAARAVGLTPAAFGQRIQKLEGQLGVKLFVRTTRSVHLTEAGSALREPVTRCLSLAEETIRAARGDTAPHPMELVVGARHDVGLSWLLPQVDLLERARPWLQLHLYFGSGPDLLLRVRTFEIDCAVTSSRLTDPKLDSLRLHREDYFLCAATGLLSRKALARPEDAANNPLIAVSVDLPKFRYWREAEGGKHLTFGRIV